MSDESSGAGQGALPPRQEGLTSSRSVVERPAVRLTQVAGGQYLITSQSHGMPALAQISAANVSSSNVHTTQGGITRIISLNPSRGHIAPLRPSVANQNIVNALTKSRPGGNVRLQLFSTVETSTVAQTSVLTTTTTTRSPVKRSFPFTSDDRDVCSSARSRRILDHKIVRSKLVNEKYNEHLREKYYVENINGNLLEFPHFAKRPKTQHYITHLKENIIDPKEAIDEDDPQLVLENTTVTHSAPNSSVPVVQDTVAVTSSNSSAFVQSTSSELNSSSTTITSSNNNGIKMRMSSSYTTSSNQEQIVEKAKQEAYVVQRISDLQKEGLWSEKRLPKVQEMSRGKAHWDFLLEEMVWLAADFAQERKWKKAAAKKCARMVQKYFQDKALAAQRAEKAQEQHLKRIAAFCAKEIKSFWSNVEKLVEYKQNTRLEEKRKKALDQHLSFIVDQTEKYSQLLAEGMNKSLPNASSEGVSAPSSKAPSRTNSDEEFQPDQESTDDEETIAQEEARVLEHDQCEEVAALQRESEMDLVTFLNELPKDYLQNRDAIVLSGSDEESDESDDSDTQKSDKSKPSKSSKKLPQEKDEDFVINSSSEDDDEVTIQEQEAAEGKQDHQEELDDLKVENELSIEELRRKYSSLPPIPSDQLSLSSESDSDSSAEGDKEESSEDESVAASSDVDMSMSEDECQNSEEVGLKSLLDDSQNEGDTKTEKQDLIDDAAAIAESIQPKGNTLSSTSVVTRIPFLLKYTLREYQHIGLDWLVTMFERKLNGILADEMGLGKTIQTIALLAHLACEKENWGPHLIIVPTSVMLNWEMECKKWCPAFKILTYYGTQKERKQKRMGWTKPNAFHVCITSYKLVIQDHQSFRRKKWKYLILDEAQNIKNFKSQRWQLLLNFTTQQRLLLTGTPLQNNLMELWSLMHFLMPHVFQSHREFKEWFSNPVTGMIEGNSEYNESIIKRLHKVLRPFLLRRLKCEVEKQMPKKYEHVVMCRLSKRQRFLYDDYMSRAKTKETLAGGNLLSVINVLMQLRKVCNHPNLFEVRPTISPFQCDGVTWHIPSIVYGALEYNVWKHISLYSMNLNLILMELYLSAYQCYRMRQYQTPRKLIEEIDSLEEPPPYCPSAKLLMRVQKINRTETKSNGKDGNETKNSANILIPKPGQTINTQTNLKLRISPQNVLHLVPHSSPLKVVTHQVSTSQSSAVSQNASTINLSSVLKPEKLMFQPGIAQLVQTPTGKHILLTPTGNTSLSTTFPIPGSTTVVTTGGQRLTLLPKQVNTGQVTPMSRGLPKIQLVSVSSTPSTTVTTTTSSVIDLKNEDEKETGKKTVGNKFLNKLYSQKTQSNSLDVRWKKQKTPSPKRNRHSVYKEGSEMEIVDHYKNKLDLIARVNERRCSAVPLYGKDFHDSIKIFKCSENPAWNGGRIHCLNALFNMNFNNTTDCLRDILHKPDERIEELKDTFDRFLIYVSAVHAPEPELRVWHPNPSKYWGEKQDVDVLTKYFSKPATCLHPIASAMVTQFPDPRLIQYDCGKLQTLDRLLRRLKTGGHRVLIFTQMTKMLDVLEAFLNFHGHIYLRLDGSTKVDQRQVLMERFNGDTRIFAFILSTRSGGIGVNLTGADTVIFYDSDWNPTMDAQAQDRCHRIGQTRDVHIYRLVSERTIEENILKKANQKRLLGDLAIEGGNFTTAYFKSSTIQDLFDIDNTEESAANRMSDVIQCSKEREKYGSSGGGSEPSTSASTPVPEDKTAMGALENALAACEDDQDVLAARTAKAEAVADLAEFDENIPLEEQERDKEKEMEISKAEMEVENLVKQLTPIERYAMRFIEETEAAWSAEQLAAAEREIEEQKREWERNRFAALREEEKRRARELEEENDILTYSREDATNQVSTKNKKLNVQGTSIVGGVVKKFKKAKSRVRNVKRAAGGRGKHVRKNNKLDEATKREMVSDSDSDEKIESFNKKQNDRAGENVDLEQEISQTPTETSDSTSNPNLNGDGTDNEIRSDSGEDCDEEEQDDNDEEMEEDDKESDNSNSSNSITPITPNHVDHNSPRTRSRGTVAINLWTLDVSPILPGVRPVKNSPNVQNHRKDKKSKERDDEDIKKGFKKANSTLIENKDVKGGGNNRKVGKIKNLSSSDEHKITNNSKIVKSINKSKHLKNTKIDSDKNKEIKDEQSADLLDGNAVKEILKKTREKIKKAKEMHKSEESKNKNALEIPDNTNVVEPVPLEDMPSDTSYFHTKITSHSNDEKNTCVDESPLVNEPPQAMKEKNPDYLEGCYNINDKSFGKNGRICKVVVTDILADATLAKELSKYKGTKLSDSSNEFIKREKHEENVSQNVNRNEDTASQSKTQTNKKLPTLKKLIPTRKPFLKKRRIMSKQNTSLDNWLIKSHSPNKEVSESNETNIADTTTESIRTINTTSDDDNLANKLINDEREEVTENIAVKAEITKVENDVGDIVVNTIKEDSLKRTCTDSESIDDKGIKTNKIIKTA